MEQEKLVQGWMVCGTEEEAQKPEMHFLDVNNAIAYREMQRDAASLTIRLQYIQMCIRDRLRVSLMEGIRSLAQMPERCPYLDEEDRRSPYRKLHIPKWYLVIYVVVRCV